jgi:hypothetical protein
MAVPAPPRLPQLDRNEAILRAKVALELDRGARFLEQRVEHLFTGFPGMLLNPLAGAAYRAVGRDEIVRRATFQLDTILAAARTHGEKPEAIFDGHLTTYLSHDEAYVRANRRHPRYQELEGLLREVYVARVEPVSLLMHKGIGESYPDLVRSVFPSRAAATNLLQREFLYSDRIMVMAEREHGLLHMPPFVGHDVLRLLREAYDWYKDRAMRSLDGVYVLT